MLIPGATSDGWVFTLLVTADGFRIHRQPVTVRRDGRQRVAVSLSPGGLTISGYVIGLNSKPISGASVLFKNSSVSQSWIAETTTDQDGRFSVSCLDPGDYGVVVVKDGYTKITSTAKIPAPTEGLCIVLSGEEPARGTDPPPESEKELWSALAQFKKGALSKDEFNDRIDKILKDAEVHATRLIERRVAESGGKLRADDLIDELRQRLSQVREFIERELAR